MHRVAFGGVEHPHGIRVLARLVERVRVGSRLTKAPPTPSASAGKILAQPVLFVALQVAALITESELEPWFSRTTVSVAGSMST